jgi:hypothetical protein
VAISQQIENEQRIQSEQNIDAVIYPNPNNGSGFILDAIDLKNEQVRVTITDALGKVIFDQAYAVDGYINTTIQTQYNLSNGMYFVQLADGERFTSFKMIVE